MTSCDTNILFAACDTDSRWHAKARRFLEEQAGNARFCLCEQALMELYCLLRNPAACAAPLDADEAADLIHAFRANPHWRIVDVIPGHGIMDRVWKAAAHPPFAFRRIFDLRLAQTLLHHGVRSFATRNIRDFQDVGFHMIWDPTSGS